MSRRVLDTSFLISWWHKRHRPQMVPAEARDAARELIELYGTNAIVTPVYVEFICWAHNSHELELFRAFLGEFARIDDGQITRADWSAATSLAERIARDAKPRQLGDCLIRAIATRLHHDVMSLDAAFPR